MDEFPNSCTSDVVFSIRQSNNRAWAVWKIEDFSTLRAEEKVCYSSPSFLFQTVEWNLKLHPVVYNYANVCKVGLFLFNRLQTSLNLKFQFIVKNESGQDYNSKVKKSDFSQDQYGGFGSFFMRQDLLDGKLGNFLPNDVLTICCKMETVKNLDTETLTITGPEKYSSKNGKDFVRDSFQSDFRESFDSGRFSDVVLRVREETIPAHKVILSAHSNVFKAMFESNMKEVQDNTVDLVDMDLTVAKSMLLYIYTREVEKLSAEKTLELYVAADRYMLTELKEKCREYLAENMSPKNVGDVFEVASLHCDTVLTNAAQNFFAANVMSILKLQEWKDFTVKKSSISIELLSFVISSNNLY